ncbi:MAG TPA: 2-oxoacid:acceptor oxidoreductase family protein [Spirochaetota bacterium]|jgi:2-oxoglutarate ferredoxin oxidoreductase subunit gamma|nr:MAG: Pyruvate synthase subunit PorC [Spirochaetes bacterium ADurb.Bin133]HNZ26171.1 2-oxoacid:acceptor oxidoreductase family protein [Spirochaetota bacterium]HOF01457.1 2-oxoacid:acceptor oxidoreductase family protein [Spirochaetota bacterium]HOS33303.1 2-oxoacid:acceptor oxidoreductase family protein [Spirochaetota bacterium]HOS55761.1 2-oxoacid:acceptor oxidoreductase family protein [Spirochaetota bacterium]
MLNKIVLAGFGGQGIIVAGKLLAISAMNEKKETTHYPSYGAEMRGGTCSCSVVVGDNLIASPIIKNPDIALIFNKPSKEKYEPLMRHGGIMILNKSLIEDTNLRGDIKKYLIKASEIAEQLGSVKSTNMVMLGAFVKATSIIKLDAIINSLTIAFPNAKEKAIELNIRALEAGYNNLE